MRFKRSTLSSAYHRLVAAQFIGYSTLIYPLYSIMFSERSQISAVGVGTLLAAWQLSKIVAEVPTGVIADRYSKKYSIMLGYVFKSFCFAVWFVYPQFYGYLAGFILWGIGEAFTSGAVQAYLYELGGEKEGSNYLKRFSRLKSIEMVAYAAAYVVTYLIGPEYQLLVGLSASSSIIAFIITITLPQSPRVAHVPTITTIISSATQTLANSLPLKQRFIKALLIAGMLAMLLELMVVNYRDFGASVEVIPLLISGSALVSAVTFWLLHRYEAFFDRRQIPLLITFSVLYVFTYQLGTWWQIFGLFAVARYIRVLAVVQEADIMRFTKDVSRATVMSSFSLASTGIAALQLFLVGLFAINESITLPTLYFVIGSLLLFIVLHRRTRS